MGVFLFYTVCVSKYNVEMPTPSLGDEDKMKIVVLEGSPNKDGSSNLLATEFVRGAKEGGHSVQVIDAAHEDIHPCPVFESERRGHGAWDRMRNSQYDSVF